MFFIGSFPWIYHALALLIYGGLLIFLLANHRLREHTEQRLGLYIGLAVLSVASYVVSFGNWAFDEIRIALTNLHFYAQSVLPLFYFAVARAYIRLDRQPWLYVVGVIAFIALLLVDLLQVSVTIYEQLILASTIVLSLRIFIGIFYYGHLLLIGTQEYLHQSSPLHRNRLIYLALASVFLLADSALTMMPEEIIPALPIILQVVGVLILAYGTLQHALIDLRTLLRRSIYFIIITAFTALIYFFALQAALALLRGEDLSRSLTVAILAALVLALVYQPLHNLAQRLVEKLLFGKTYDVQAVVGEFSQRLGARIVLDEFAQEGRRLLQNVMGARDARLLIVERDGGGYVLSPLPMQENLPATIRLSLEASVTQVLVTHNTPLLQYDIDRLAQYQDLAPETRANLQRLMSEAYVPVKSRGALIGIWSVSAKLSGDRYSEEDLALLTTLAGQSAVALENARLLADLRHQMVEARSMRDYLDSTMASISTGVMTLDPEGKIISLNRAAENIFRVSAIGAIGKPYQTILPDLESVQFRLLLARLWAQTAQHLVRDAVTQVAGRGEVHLTLHLSPMRRGDQMVGVAVVIDDLTEQARLEQERRAEEQEKQRVRETFEHYVAPTVVQGLLADPSRVQLGGERQLVTLLFADIHGFSALSEQLPPEELVDVLNGYLSIAYRSILQFEGTVDKYMGDGMMAIFNAPMPQSDHAMRAAKAALTLHREIDKFARRIPRSQRLTFRIGLHTGEAIVGNIGTQDLMNYTAIGDTVNVAKRLQENAHPGQTLLSRSTYGLIQDHAVVTKSQIITIKGRSAPVEVFDLSDLHYQTIPVSK